MIRAVAHTGRVLRADGRVAELDAEGEGLVLVGPEAGVEHLGDRERARLARVRERGDGRLRALGLGVRVLHDAALHFWRLVQEARRYGLGDLVRESRGQAGGRGGPAVLEPERGDAALEGHVSVLARDGRVAERHGEGELGVLVRGQVGHDGLPDLEAAGRARVGEAGGGAGLGDGARVAVLRGREAGRLGLGHGIGRAGGQAVDGLRSAILECEGSLSGFVEPDVTVSLRERLGRESLDLDREGEVLLLISREIGLDGLLDLEAARLARVGEAGGGAVRGDGARLGGAGVREAVGHGLGHFVGSIERQAIDGLLSAVLEGEGSFTTGELEAAVGLGKRIFGEPAKLDLEGELDVRVCCQVRVNILGDGKRPGVTRVGERGNRLLVANCSNLTRARGRHARDRRLNHLIVETLRNARDGQFAACAHLYARGYTTSETDARVGASHILISPYRATRLCAQRDGKDVLGVGVRIFCQVALDCLCNLEIARLALVAKGRREILARSEGRHLHSARRLVSVHVIRGEVRFSSIQIRNRVIGSYHLRARILGNRKLYSDRHTLEGNRCRCSLLRTDAERVHGLGILAVLDLAEVDALGAAPLLPRRDKCERTRRRGDVREVLYDRHGLRLACVGKPDSSLVARGRNIKCGCAAIHHKVLYRVVIRTHRRVIVVHIAVFKRLRERDLSAHGHIEGGRTDGGFAASVLRDIVSCTDRLGDRTTFTFREAVLPNAIEPLIGIVVASTCELRTEREATRHAAILVNDVLCDIERHDLHPHDLAVAARSARETISIVDEKVQVVSCPCIAAKVVEDVATRDIRLCLGVSRYVHTHVGTSGETRGVDDLIGVLVKEHVARRRAVSHRIALHLGITREGQARCAATDGNSALGSLVSSYAAAAH